MRLRTYRRTLLRRSQSVDPSDRYYAPALAGLARFRRIRRSIRIGSLLTIIGVIRLARGVRCRWQSVLAGTALTTTGVMVHASLWVLIPIAVLFLAYLVMVPARSAADRGAMS
jgi:hypothetical protein